MNNAFGARIFWPAFLLAGCCAVILLFLFNPLSTRWLPACPFHKLTGFDCPGCGSTRGMHSLLHGDFIKAADFNVLLLPALPMLCIGVYNKISGKADRLWAAVNRPRLILAIVCIFWIARNIPAYPFSWLASGS